jgi:hypothetical protein
MHKTQDEKDEPLGEGEDGAAKKEANQAAQAIYQVPRVINILLMGLLHSEFCMIKTMKETGPIQE